MKRWTSGLFVILCLMLLLMTPLYGQKITGTISGVVTDPSGAVIPGATVVVTNSAMGFARTVITNEMGEYVAAELAAGTYQLAVRQTNYREAVTSAIELHVASTALVNVQL